jgi:release factor glutamine methyltransferase
LGFNPLQPQAFSPVSRQRAIELWGKHLNTGIPLQYLLGEVYWRDFVLQIEPGVLIPRPETELLVDWVTGALPPGPLQIADLGTGSGCLAIGLARALPQAKIYAIDLDPHCLAVARRNAERLEVQERIQFLQGSWLAPLTQSLDALVSNPPYIPHGQLTDLEPLVRDHEPHLALDGGADGLDAFRVLAQQGAQRLKSGGLWAVEVMQGQSAQVEELLVATGQYRQIETKPDLEGNPRFVLAYRI